MAWAERIPSSGRYRGRYRDASGRAYTLDGPTFGRKSEAQRAASVKEDEVRRRPGSTSRLGRQTWAAWRDEWWARRAREVEPGTLVRDLSRRAKYLDPQWDARRLDRVTRDDVQDWVDELVDDGSLKPHSVTRIYRLFSAGMRAAIKAGRIAYTPCVEITLPTVAPADDRFLTPDEVRTLFHFLPGDADREIAWTLVGTGLRWGELSGLHAHRLDLGHKRLDVRETYDDRMREVKPWPKGRRVRSVPLPSWLADMLADRRDAGMEVSGCGSAHRGGGRCSSGLVFPGRDGGPLPYSTWRRGPWEQAVRLAGLGPVRIHDLRHTYASWLVQNGRDLTEVRDLLGHSTITVTERYADLAQARWDGVRDVLGEVVTPLLPQLGPTAIAT